MSGAAPGDAGGAEPGDAGGAAPAAAPAGKRRAPAARATEPWVGLKIGVAGSAVALLGWGAWLQRRGRDERLRRTRDAALAGLGVVGGLLWWNLGAFHSDGSRVHDSEFYHYYLGAKYFDELGYDRLYLCTAVADLEDGAAGDLRRRRLRDLETNRLRRASDLVAIPERCKRHFEDERWTAFKADVAWFRARRPPWRWRQFQMDHGYNPTPAWGILGTTLSQLAPARAVPVLSLLDPALLAVAFGAIAWGFGWRVLCIALVFFGTNHFARFGWTGGAFLRQDWLVALLIGVVLLRRGRHAGAGFLMTTAALLRVFPAVAIGAVALRTLTVLWRRRRLGIPPGHGRFAAGSLLALALVVPLSIWTAGGAAVWRDFAENSRRLVATPAWNHMGLRAALVYDPARRIEAVGVGSAEDPLRPWRIARLEAVQQRRPITIGLVLVFGVLLWRAVGRQPDWVAATLGIGAIPIAGDLSGYYLAVLLALAFLWPVHPGVGVGLLGLALASRLLALGLGESEPTFAGSSLGAVLLAFAATWWMGSAPPASDPNATRAGPASPP